MDNFVNGTSAVYVDQLYDQWKENPKSVHASWQAYFKNMEIDAAEPYSQPPTMGHGMTDLDIIMAALKEKTYSGESIQSIGSETVEQAQSDAFKVMSLIRAFMTHGHLTADLDPLKLQETYGEDSSSQFHAPHKAMKKLVELSYYGFEEKDMDKTFYIDLPQFGGILQKKKTWTLRELHKVLKEAYSGKIGVEFMHVPNAEMCTWIRNNFELRQFNPIQNA